MSNSVLSEMDWDEGFAMPVANTENKALEEEVLSKQKKMTSAGNELEHVNDRVAAMSEHLKNVRQELQHTQGLVNARIKELETETHLKKVAEREGGRLKQEIQRLNKELEELKEKKNISENNIFRQTQRLEELKSQMNWDQQALEAWLEESARKDEDAMTIQKYARQDEGKIKELVLRMSHLTDEAYKKRHLLDRETTDTLTTQLELDKTAEEFRKAHADRQNLIQQWENTIDQMQRRDKEMDMLASQLARVKAEVRNRDEAIKEKQQFLDNEIENNKEMEKKISVSERQAGRVRLDWQDAEKSRTAFQDELDALRRTVDRTAIDLETTRSTVSQLRKDVQEKHDKLRVAQDMRQKLIERLKAANESELTAEERAAAVEALLSQEEQRQTEIDGQLKYLHDLQFRKTQELHGELVKERNDEAEIQGSRAAIRNLNSKINKLDHDSLKQQEIIYNQDFSIQQLERRINRMQGERSNEEKLLLEARLKELTEELEEKNSTHSLINLQLKRLQDDIRRVKRDLETSGAEKSNLTSKIEELHLYNDSSQRELQRLISSKQDLMVDDNILKLELKRLRDTLYSKADDVMSLEKRKLQLETAMNERKHEIGIHKDMLSAQIKGADTERQQISSELHERISKIDKLRKRYEILMVSMAPPEGEEEQTQAYYVIKAAQEKEELQREGDDLDAKIRKAEKEIRALENTLRLMNSRNEQYRKSFNKVTDTSEEMEDKQQVEEQLRAVMDKYKYKRRQIRELQEDLGTMSNTLDNLVRDENVYSEMIDEKKNRILQLNKEIDEQKTKLDRVSKVNTKYARDLRSAKKSKGETPEERDFNIRELRDFNKNVMKQIGEIISDNPDIAQTATMYFTQANLPPPPVTGGVYSARSSASRSTMSARSQTSSIVGKSPSAATPVNIAPEFGTPPGSAPGSARSGQSTVRSSASSKSSAGRRRELIR
ncbi:coiled-coil domain-containing protein 39-like [Tubulanus polymorphus]|uniref:coiled-coil domain-containing protein 39-like n=1 Tax=Tubulanus polymorphus TaxID=672921 RepID=UPI003DA40C9B